MTAQDVLDRLSQAGITVVVDVDRLRCRSAAPIPAALGALVAAHKGEIIKLLEQPLVCAHNGLPRVEWSTKDGARRLGEFCGLCGQWLRWMRQDEANLARVTVSRPSAWVQTGPSRVRMAAPAPGEDATREDSIRRREAHFRERWAGVDHPVRLVELPPDTCLVCGCHPIAKPGDYRCALCMEAASNVVAERDEQRKDFRQAVEAVFGKNPCIQVSDFDAFRDLCRRRWPDVSSDERLERSLEFLADLIERFIELGAPSAQARARAVWDRLEVICERRRAAK